MTQTERLRRGQLARIIAARLAAAGLILVADNGNQLAKYYALTNDEALHDGCARWPRWLTGRAAACCGCRTRYSRRLCVGQSER